MDNGDTLSARKRPRQANNGSSSDFVAAASWQGSRQGYYFGTGDKGTGYYLDQKSDKKSSNSSSPPAKSARRTVVIAEDRNETHTVPRTGGAASSTMSADELLAQAEASVQQQGKTIELTDKGIQQAGVALNKALNKNQMQRAKHPDEPEKYMDSEVALYESIRGLQAIASLPEKLYEPMMEAEIPSTLLQLVSQHENSDIMTAIWAVWAEWIDPTLLQLDDSERRAAKVIIPVVDLTRQLLKDGLEILMESLGRLGSSNDNTSNGDNEEEDDVGQGVGDILTVVEHLMEIDTLLPLLISEDDGVNANGLTIGSQSLTQQLCQAKYGFVAWLLEQVNESSEEENKKTKSESPSPSPSNKNRWKDRSLEILALLAPREELYNPSCCPYWSQIRTYQSVWGSSSKKSVTLDGIEILLQGVAKFRKRQPIDEIELDALENTCIILDAALTFGSENVETFLEAQGIELVFRCIKERVHAGGVALKWLDFMGSKPIHQQACQHMVHKASALKYLFPLLMDRNVPKPATLDAFTKKEIKRRKKEWHKNLQETAIRILYTLTRQLPDKDEHDCQTRLIAKFIDDDDKCERLVELLLQYDQKARTAEYNFYRSDVEESLPDEEAIQLAALEAKLEGGGDLFHRLGAIAAFLCVHSRKCHQTILAKLNQQQSGMSLLTASLEEFVTVLGDSDQKQKLESFLEKL